MEQLAFIWQKSDTQNLGALNLVQFRKALNWISKTQVGEDINLVEGGKFNHLKFMNLFH